MRKLIFLTTILVVAGFPCDAQVRNESPLTRPLPGRSDAERRSHIVAGARHAVAGFVENKGQFVDARGRLIPDVLFKASLGGVDVYVTTHGITYVFARMVKERGSERPRANERLEGGERGRMEWRRVDMRLTGARIRKENVVAARPVAQGHLNYYPSHRPRGITRVAAFQQVVISEVYPGVDWRLSDDGARGLKQEFVVRPGARPTDIRMSYAGAGRVAGSRDGSSLRIKTTLGEIEEGALLTHQGNPNRPVNSRYDVRGNEARFVVGAYDTRRELIIDPPLHLVWATLYGGGGVDGPWSLAFDAADNVYVVGYTSSTNFPIQPMGSAYVGQSYSNASNTDAFIVKFDHAGARQWATYYGSPAQDLAYGVVADKLGNVYVTGETAGAGSSFPTMTPANSTVTVQSNNAGGTDAFLLKFDPSGIREWATLYGGGGYDRATGITVDPTGNVYTVGFTMSSNLPVNPPPVGSANWQPNNAGGIDAFVTKYNPTGTREWATYYGGSGGDFGWAITWHNTPIFAGVCVAGSTTSPNLFVKPLSVSYDQPTPGGNQDAFILAIHTTGIRIWATYYGGDGADSASAVASGWNYALYVTGSSTPVSTTPANSFPTHNPGGGAFYQPAYSKTPPYPNTPSNIYNDAFILMFDHRFSRKWATLFGGTKDDFGHGVTTDFDFVNGNVHLAGTTGSTDLPVYNPGGNVYFDGTYNGGEDVFLASFSRAGVPQWTTYAGGTGWDFPRAIGASSLNCLFVTGEFNSTPNTLPLLDPGGVYFQNTNSAINGFDEGFVMKFCY